MTGLFCNEVFDKKEGKKEDDELCVFDVKQFQTLTILLQVLTILISVLLATLKNTWQVFILAK